jgi:hypothetical protein
VLLVAWLCWPRCRALTAVREIRFQGALLTPPLLLLQEISLRGGFFTRQLKDRFLQ